MKLVDLKNIVKKEEVFNLKNIKIISGTVYLIYGDSLSGKTAFCLKVCKESLMKRKDAKVLYIDTEDKVTGRLQKASFTIDVANLSERFFLTVEMNQKEFENMMKGLDAFIEKNNISILVVDSIVSPFLDIEHPKQRTSRMKNVMKIIKTLTQKYSLISLVTTHVYKNYSNSSNPGVAVPIGGGGVNFYSDEKIQLKFTANNPLKRIIKNVVDNNETIVEIEAGLTEEKA